MNTRILELLQQPQLIQPEDLNLLEKQIQANPYVQNIRALYLYGVHQHQPQRYKETLTITAAYTTDKKILYQFINQKEIQQESVINDISEPKVAPAPEEKIDNKEDVKEEVVDVEKSEENNLIEEIIAEEPEVEAIIEEPVVDIPSNENEKEVIDVEKSEGVAAIEEAIAEEPKTEAIVEESVVDISENEIEEIVEEENLLIENNEQDLNFSKDEIITEETIETETKEVGVNISFEAIDEFLPNVKFSIPKNHSTFLNPPKFEKPKPQEIIEPIVSEKSTGIIDDVIIDGDNDTEVNFHETVNFEEFVHEDIIVEQTIAENNTIEEIEEEKVEVVEINIPQEELLWKPMSFDTNVPDALLGKAKLETKTEESIAVISEEVQIEKPEEEIKPELIESVKEDLAEVEEARPIMNVSFFSDAMSIVPDEVNAKPETPTISLEIIEEKPNLQPNSNVGKFINTWQSWLKIDRTEEIEKEKEVLKNKVIEQFIENQPKISQLKDEVNFVVKEKKEDISHLMTETFANLYIEQKLYTKAINAFEVLIKKHPEKADYFQKRIEEVKDMRKPF